MKKVLIGIGVAFAMLVIIGIAIGGEGEDEAVESPTAAPIIEEPTAAPVETEEPTAVPTEEWELPEAMARDIFVEGCLDGDEGYHLWCRCTWDSLVAEFGYEYVLEVSTSGTDDEIFEMNLAVVGRCNSVWPE